MDRKYRILLAEDELCVRSLLKRYLEARGFEVLCAGNGREALELHRAMPADLVLSDVDMPEMDGLELLSRVRETDPELPAILVSGHGVPLPVAAAGNYRFLAKPLSLPQLEQQIRLAIGSSRAQRPVGSRAANAGAAVASSQHALYGLTEASPPVCFEPGRAHSSVG